MRHDDIVKKLRSAVNKVSRRDVADAFVASLTSAPATYRATLRSWAYASNFPEHGFLPSLGDASYECAVCGLSKSEDLERSDTIASKEDGGFVDTRPTDALVDLEHFAGLPRVRPTDADRACLRKMLEIAGAQSAKVTGSMLGERWGKLIPRTNKYTRASFVETLGACGILQTDDHPGFFTRFVEAWEMNEAPRLSGEMDSPASFWTGADGLDFDAVESFFPELGLRNKSKPRLPVRKIVREAVRLKRTKIELAPGDLVDLGFEDLHVIGVMLGSDGKGCPVIEFYGGSFKKVPTPAELRKRGAHTVGPYRDAPAWRREPFALEEMEALPRVMSVPITVIAHDAEPPRAKGEPRSVFRRILGRNLLYMLSTVVASKAARA